MKLNISVLLAGLLFLVASCATHDKQKAHHHHLQACDKDACDVGQCQMYEKRCAYSVSNGDMNVMASDKHKLEHEGHTYYFSSKEKMEVFKEDLAQNVKKANENWGAFKWQQLKR